MEWRGAVWMCQILRDNTKAYWPYVSSYLLLLLVCKEVRKCKKVLDSKTRTVQSSEGAMDSKHAVLQWNHYGIPVQ